MKIFKQLDKLVGKGFIGPYLISFLVAEFVLVLQFIWQHIDDFIGRGVSVAVLIEMVFFYSLTIIPLALPISILISSVMVYGNLAEKYELTSFKSAGVSMIRIMRPGILIALVTAAFSIFASNYLKPNAFLSFYQIFDNVRRAKPTLTIDQGIFNYDFKGYAIRVGEKEQDGQGIGDVLIYDQTERRLMGLITAKKGKMYTSSNGQNFTMELYDGVQYSEMERKSDRGKKDNDQFMRIYFDKYIKQFDMSEFEFALSNNSLGRRKHDLYNSFQMQKIIDSLDIQMVEKIEDSRYYFENLLPGGEETDIINKSLDNQTENAIKNYNNKDDLTADSKKASFDKSKPVQNKGKQVPLPMKKTSQQGKPAKVVNNKDQKYSRSSRFYADRVAFRKEKFSLDTMTTIASTIEDAQLKNFLFRAKAQAQTLKERYRGIKTTTGSSMYSRNKFELRLHQQLCWAVICILFVFIGASLGSIVRKGGFGYPLLIAIVFFVLFIFSNILGEKLMGNGTVSAIFGAWLPCFIVTPFSIWFTIKAIKDSSFNFNIKSLFS